MYELPDGPLRFKWTNSRAGPRPQFSSRCFFSFFLFFFTCGIWTFFIVYVKKAAAGGKLVIAQLELLFIFFFGGGGILLKHNTFTWRSKVKRTKMIDDTEIMKKGKCKGCVCRDQCLHFIVLLFHERERNNKVHGKGLCNCGYKKRVSDESYLQGLYVTRSWRLVDCCKALHNVFITSLT